MSIDPSAPIRSTCPYCGVGCGVLAQAGRKIIGDPLHPANQGRLCSKGSALGETLSLDGRLQRPEIDGVPTSWDAALDEVARRFAATIAQHGPDSVALYVSGQLLTEDYYAANKFAKSVLGTANIDSNSRLCMASAVAGHRRGFGEDVVPGIYEDLELADLVVLVGSNTAWCHPVLFQRLQAARALRPEIRVVVIDPRRTATCEDADLHLPLLPGSDVALFGGLLADLDRRGLVSDRLGDSAAALAVTPDLAQTTLLTGLEPALLTEFYQWFAATPRVVTLFSQGVNQSSAGTDKVNAILNVHLATGRIGLPGAGPFSITGQPNAMGGREVGALANMLAAHLEFDVPGDAETLAAFWQVPAVAPRPGLKAVELFRAIADRRVRAVWIIATNPAVSLPDGDAVRAALAGCDCVVVSDSSRDTDTMALAHIRLPALAWGEKDGTVTNSERVISRQRAFLPQPGAARPDWWAIAQVATRLGHGARFAWDGPAAIFREHAALSGTGRQRVFDISGLADLDDAGYAQMAPTRWPCPAAGPAPARLFSDGVFPTADGRARLVPTAPRGAIDLPDADFPLVLMTGRVRDQWHTMTRTGKTARLLAHIPEPFLALHPDDAGSMEDGDLVWAKSRFGGAVLRLRLDVGQRPGTGFAPMHWTDQFCAAGRINPLVSPATDPVSGQPELKYSAIHVRPFHAAWHGFVLTRDALVLPPGFAGWHARLPAEGGIWRHELAGDATPAAAFATLLEAMPAGAAITLRDEASGLHRAVKLREGRLESCIFIARTAALPPRDWLTRRFADADLAGLRRALLAGQPPGVVADPAVCVCNGVGQTAIRAAIAAGADSVAAIGAATQAGTGCGSCKPELRALLGQARPMELAVPAR